MYLYIYIYVDIDCRDFCVAQKRGAAQTYLSKAKWGGGGVEKKDNMAPVRNDAHANMALARKDARTNMAPVRKDAHTSLPITSLLHHPYQIMIFRAQAQQVEL